MQRLAAEDEKIPAVLEISFYGFPATAGTAEP